MVEFIIKIQRLVLAHKYEKCNRSTSKQKYLLSGQKSNPSEGIQGMPEKTKRTRSLGDMEVVTCDPPKLTECE